MHGDWALARTDLEAAIKAGAAPEKIAFARAQLAAAAQDWNGAAAELPLLTKSFPQNPEIWRLAAGIHRARDERDELLKALRTAATTANPPLPDDYMALALEFDAQGEAGEALAALDEAIQKIGWISSFVETALAIEERRERWGEALERIDAALKHLPNAARWYARKGDIAEKAKRPEEARSARTKALEMIDALPEARKLVPANAELAARLRAILEQPTQP